MNGWAIDSAMSSVYGGYFWDNLDYAIKTHGDVVTLDGKEYKVEYIEMLDCDYEYSSQMHVIFKFGDKTYKKRGHYQSHYGSEWDGSITEVTPKTITVTEWEDV